MQYANGNRYIGTWRNDQMNGMGVWFDAKKGTKQQGEWKLNKRLKWIGNATK